MSDTVFGLICGSVVVAGCVASCVLQKVEPAAVAMSCVLLLVLTYQPGGPFRPAQ